MKPLIPPKKSSHCEMCGHPGAKRRKGSRVFDRRLPPPGCRERYLCADAKACARRFHELMATWGTMTFDPKTNLMVHRMTAEGRKRLAAWSAACYRVPPI